MFVMVRLQKNVHKFRDACKMGRMEFCLFLLVWALIAGFVTTLLDLLLILPDQE